MGHRIAYFRTDWPDCTIDSVELSNMTEGERLSALFCRVEVRDDGSYVLADPDPADAMFPGSDAMPYTQENHGAVLYDSIPDALAGCIKACDQDIDMIRGTLELAAREAVDDTIATANEITMLEALLPAARAEE